MKRLVLSGLLLAMAAFGAVSISSGADAGQLIGEWVGDADTTLDRQGLAAQKSDPLVADMIKSLEDMLGGMKMTFTADKITAAATMMGETQSETWGYKVVSAEGDKLVIESTDGKEQGNRMTVTFLDDSHMAILEEGGDAKTTTYLKRPGAPGLVSATPAAAAPAPELPPADETDTAMSPNPTEIEAAPQEAPVVVTPTAPAIADESATPTFVVFMPEQIDQVWYWWYYTEEQQHIVQSEMEKALTDAGYDVVDLSMADIFKGGGSIAEVYTPREAMIKAKELGATYAIIGKASAVMQSGSQAYGVTVIRSQVEAEAKVYRVSDGKVLDVEMVNATEGGQAQKAAAQKALKTAGMKLAGQIKRALATKLQIAPP